MGYTAVVVKDGNIILDGIELIHRVSQLNLGTIFVVISAYRDFNYARKACELSAFIYLLKPFSSEEFTKVLSA